MQFMDKVNSDGFADKPYLFFDMFLGLLRHFYLRDIPSCIIRPYI